MKNQKNYNIKNKRKSIIANKNKTTYSIIKEKVPKDEYLFDIKNNYIYKRNSSNKENSSKYHFLLLQFFHYLNQLYLIAYLSKLFLSMEVQHLLFLFPKNLTLIVESSQMCVFSAVSDSLQPGWPAAETVAGSVSSSITIVGFIRKLPTPSFSILPVPFFFLRISCPCLKSNSRKALSTYWHDARRGRSGPHRWDQVQTGPFVN